MIQNLKQIINQEISALQNIPLNNNYQKAVNLIIQHVHKQNGKLVCSGMGKAGQIAANIATTFSSTGTPACFIHPSEAQHGDLGLIKDNDIMLLISNSGKTREILELINLARKLVPNIKFIAITGNNNGILAENADVCILTGSPKEVCPLGLTPTTSITVMTVIGDLLVVETMKKTGFTAADYAKRHHSGYLGDMARKQATNNTTENK
jgi:arabinose-5-phosphate isomerase